MSYRAKQSLILFFLLITASILWWSQHPDPGYFQRSFTARIYQQWDTGTLTLDLSHSSPATAPFLIILSQITGISMFETMYFPVAAFGRGLLYIALLWILTKSLWYSGAFGVLMSLYPWAGYSVSTIHVHALGSVLFLTAVLVSAIVTNKRGGRTTSRDSLIFAILAISLLVIDYRMVIWVLLLLAPLGLWALVRGSNPRPLLIAVIIGVGYWLKVTPYQYVGFLGTRLSNPFEPILNYFSASSTTQPYKYSRVTDGLSSSRMFFYILFVICIVYALYRLYCMASERRIGFDSSEILLGLVTFAGGVSSVFYLFIGRFSQSFLIIGFPLLGAVALHRISNGTSQIKRALRICGTGFLLLLVISSFAVGAATNTLDYSSEANAGQAAAHLYTVSDEPTVLTDLTTAGRFKQQEALAGASANYQFYTVERYSSVVNGGVVTADYVIVDYAATNGVNAFGWEAFENFNTYRDRIHSNTNLQQTYSTGNISIYHPKT